MLFRSGPRNESDAAFDPRFVFALERRRRSHDGPEGRRTATSASTPSAPSCGFVPVVPSCPWSAGHRKRGTVLTANGFVDMDSRPSQLKTGFRHAVPRHSGRPALFWRIRPTLADRLENDGLMRTRQPGGYRPEFLGEPSVAMSRKPVSSPRKSNPQI